MLRKLKRYDEVIRSCDAPSGPGEAVGRALRIPRAGEGEASGLPGRDRGPHAGDRPAIPAAHRCWRGGARCTWSPMLRVRPCAISRRPSGSIPRMRTPTSAGAWPWRRWASIARPWPTRPKPWRWSSRPRSGSTTRPGSTPRRPIAAAAEARKTGQEAVSLVTRYQDQAMALRRRVAEAASRRRSEGDPSATCSRTRPWPRSAAACGRWSWPGQCPRRPGDTSMTW